MAVQLFTGNVIAIIWDFDQTLIPGYQQAPLFSEYGVDSDVFWKEVNALTNHYEKTEIRVSTDTIYLNHLLTYVRSGRMGGLSNAKLKELGAELDFYQGLPDFLPLAKESIESKEEFSRHDISVEHYVVSTGLRQMILGSGVAQHLDGVWACEFIEQPAEPGFLEKAGDPGELEEGGEIKQVGYFLDNTTKTRAIWEINKGVNIDSRIGVNDRIAEADRRVPIRNMIYVADGPSDIPVFSILNQQGGKTLGVYNPTQDNHFENVKALQDQGRVQAFAEANYEPTSTAAKWILSSLRTIAAEIVRDRERALADRVSRPGGHVT